MGQEGHVLGLGLRQKDSVKGVLVGRGVLGPNERLKGIDVPVPDFKLQEAGLDVDFLLAWNRPHSGDYSLDEVFSWIARITGR